MVRLGMDRPVSKKLRCRVDTPVREASSSWLSRRRVRQPRIRSPDVVGVVGGGAAWAEAAAIAAGVVVMAATLTKAAARLHYL
jgi:hypothetical protein